MCRCRTTSRRRCWTSTSSGPARTRPKTWGCTRTRTSRGTRAARRVSQTWTTLKQWIDCYDLSIRYVDDCVAVIVEKLKAAGVYEDTVIVISADHGENNGHLGIYGEHGTADHATCNIPFIVRWPNVTKPSASMRACTTTSTGRRRCSNCSASSHTHPGYLGRPVVCKAP